MNNFKSCTPMAATTDVRANQFLRTDSRMDFNITIEYAKRINISHPNEVKDLVTSDIVSAKSNIDILDKTLPYITNSDDVTEVTRARRSLSSVIDVLEGRG